LNRDKESSIFEDQRRLVQFTNLIALAVALTFSGFKLVTVGTGHLPLPALAIAICTLGNTLYLANHGSVKTATRSLLGILLLGISASGFYAGGFTGPAVILMPILLLLALLGLNIRSGWVVLALVCTVLSLLCYAEWQGSINPNPHTNKNLLLVRYFSIVSTASICTWVVWVFAHHSQRLLEVNQQLANTDYLTGIANRRALEEALGREALRTQRNKSSLSLIMIDVDQFKRYNDINGHQAGDNCLIVVAKVLQDCAQRGIDIVGRFGGEEFVVILPETEHEGACRVATDMRRAMLSRQMRYQQDKLCCVWG